MRAMSNEELTRHAIRTNADLLELTDKVDDIRDTQDKHTEILNKHTEQISNLESTLQAHVSVSQDHFRKADANFLEIRDLLAKLTTRHD